MYGRSRYESMDGLGRAKQEARAESTWMCGAIPFSVAPHLLVHKALTPKKGASQYYGLF